MSFWKKAGEAVAGSAGGIATGLIGGIGQIFSNQAQKREGRKQRKFALDMWNRQNAYNTPAKQMQRLKDAGLNPALMYGQGNVGNAQQAMGVQQSKIDNVGAAAAQSVAAGVSLDLVTKQKNLLRDQAAQARSQAFKNQIDATIGIKDYDLRKEMQQYSIDKIISDIELNDSRIDLNQSTIGVNMSVVGLNEVRSQLASAQINLTNAQERKVFTEINAITQKVAQDWTDVQTRKRDASSRELQAMAAEATMQVTKSLGEQNIKVRKQEMWHRTIGNIINGIFGLAPNTNVNYQYRSN
jgi:hypothetical protein